METKNATQMAETYGLKSPIAFNKLMVKCGVLQHTANGYVLAEALRNKGLVDIIDKPYWLPNGVKATKKASVWNEAGQEYIRNILLHHGIVPVSEQVSLFDN